MHDLNFSFFFLLNSEGPTTLRPPHWQPSIPLCLKLILTQVFYVSWFASIPHPPTTNFSLQKSWSWWKKKKPRRLLLSKMRFIQQSLNLESNILTNFRPVMIIMFNHCTSPQTYTLQNHTNHKSVWFYIMPYHLFCILSVPTLCICVCSKWW